MSRALRNSGTSASAIGDEALHVGGAAAVEPAILLRHVERVGVPVLAVDRHHVGMPGEDQAAAYRRARSSRTDSPSAPFSSKTSCELMPSSSR